MLRKWNQWLTKVSFGNTLTPDSWYNRIFNVLGLALLLYIPFILVPVLNFGPLPGRYVYPVLGIGSYLAMALTFFIRSIPFRIRSRILLSCTGTVALSVIFTGGFTGSGSMLLFALPVMAGLINRFPTVCLLLTLETAFTGTVYFLLERGILHGFQWQYHPHSSWITPTVELMFLPVVLSLAVSLVVELLQGQFRKGEREREAMSRINEKLIREINSRKKVQSALSDTREEVRFYRSFDRLTGLPNRNSFLENLGHAISRADNRHRIFAVASLGVDQFRMLNEVYGSACGDLILQKVSRLIKRATREEDYVARIEGDVFSILFADISSREVIPQMMTKLLAALHRPINLSDTTISLSITAGVCVYPYDGQSAEHLLNDSETAMFEGKKRVPGSFQFYNMEMNQEIVQTREMNQALAAALENDEFICHYQPKTDAQGKITGLEALIRWLHPVRGMIMPGDFIPRAEDNRLIIPIGQAVLRKTTDQIREWKASGVPCVPVSVNVSALQLSQMDFESQLAPLLEGIDPTLLELELTETAIQNNESQALQVMQNLEKRGVGISIDDFGTGYSSLSKLRKFPIKTLKIDKTFVDELPGEEQTKKITQTIIEMARNLDFDVVAEGVETREQLEFLQKKGCRSFQGYLFYRPMPGREIGALLSSQEPWESSEPGEASETSARRTEPKPLKSLFR